ncbi:MULTISPECIES: hypothetical protein [Acinetobacter]|uniref:hypothetical protein n=1 Tax=Acinetobacter TaxID=469 RepID=UPI00141A804C|nr:MULTISPECIES: hypothetical protein [Acinetobacter]MCS4297714.1 hypothetical protein [Acinetobacter guillouiae]MCW2251318.1 hypothetical protein [Acinetobacter sp. BIGb0204]NII36184.1 hypothetical protein [Acinetobacter sp. BIGb0196]
MQRLKCIGGPLYGLEYSHSQNEFQFIDQQTSKQTLYRRQVLDFTPPQAFFIAESISPDFAYVLALQLMGQQS